MLWIDDRGCLLGCLVGKRAEIVVFRVIIAEQAEPLAASAIHPSIVVTRRPQANLMLRSTERNRERRVVERRLVRRVAEAQPCRSAAMVASCHGMRMSSSYRQDGMQSGGHRRRRAPCGPGAASCSRAAAADQAPAPQSIPERADRLSFGGRKFHPKRWARRPSRSADSYRRA